MQSLAARTTTISRVCPKCGTIEKSGQNSCCGRGGAWFGKCGTADNTNFEHTWYEGIKGCRARRQPKAVMGHQPDVASQNTHGYFNNAETAEKNQVFMTTDNKFTFTSANASSPITTNVAYQIEPRCTGTGTAGVPAVFSFGLITSMRLGLN